MEIRFSVTLPYSEIVREAPGLKEKGLDVEVEIQDAHWLLTTCEMSSVRRVGDFLRERNIEVSVNGPIFDLNPGSFDDFIREHTKNVFMKTIELAINIGGSRVILPSGFTPFLTGEASTGWKKLSIEIWKACVGKAVEHDITVCVENRFEHIPLVLTDIVDELKTEMFGICLDIGHVHVYSRKRLPHWIKESGGITKEIQLNDNDGKTDSHLALGEGNVDIPGLFRALHSRRLWPPMVFEMSIDQAERSLKYLDSRGILSFQPKLF
ncbi:MAG: sugar phosphate isomerase/epimerase family protein [Candidatus Glassbacteria bacterium]